MIVRVRDLASALLMFPLAISAFALGVALVDTLGSISPPVSDAPATITQPPAGISSASIIGITICILVPIAYFTFIAYQMRSKPDYRYFGELSQNAFIALAVAAYVLPLVAALTIMVAFG
ncbi:hypothetical protein K239x_30080 [Planctomycetes bacterium K23_9]|uniref:Uncharacterized protein n=1 Tax=Stieleria marina TaxID=1930275 RepID=A0A517NV64_9BACT|nr:hypothetical protein K239x_30080 [Planctomycetes bacterium K23_9]